LGIILGAGGATLKRGLSFAGRQEQLFIALAENFAAIHLDIYFDNLRLLCLGK
jgi:hypothetical protein